MKIKPEEIGKEYVVDFNMMKHNVTISNDPAQFKYYQTLGLDVFEEVKIEYKPKRRGKKKPPVKEEE